MQTQTPGKLLSTGEVATIYGINENTLRFWRHEQVGPKSFRVGRKLVKYRASDVEAWLQEQYESSVVGD